MGAYRLGNSQNVTFSGTAAQSTPFGDQILKARLIATADCRIAVGPPASTTATAASTLLSAGRSLEVVTSSGEVVSVIQESSGGDLNITELP